MHNLSLPDLHAFSNSRRGRPFLVDPQLTVPGVPKTKTPSEATARATKEKKEHEEKGVEATGRAGKKVRGCRQVVGV
jgi:hypothetical protein